MWSSAILLHVCIGVAVAASDPSILTGGAEGCDFSGIDLYQKIADIVKELPPEYSQPDRKPEEVIPGIFLGTIVYKGLENFRPYGPVFSYCRNGSRLVQIDLATDDRLMEAFMPWKTCGGQQGFIGTYANARVTVTFQVVDTNADDASEKNKVKLDHHSGPTPVSVHDVSVYLRGAGDMMGGAVAIASKLFPQLPKDFWLEMVTWRLRTVIKEIIWKLSLNT
ncbi:uncharacterized protein LOC119374012 [Rhipicephalus sanguineus]|uniref:uncharacterized protein LOC119374012 n=1 Tax=Rhipicephalus sanguineus TaxID=34632 RepID=UPI001893A2C7|nr:uncharacterized protein LOC119374012 [Rhipicephalus sanguineus]